MTVTALPNIEAEALRFLRSRTEVTAICPADSISPDYGAKNPDGSIAADAPWIHLSRIGGVPAVYEPFVLDNAVLQIDCYGTSKNQARLLCDTVRKVWSVWAREQTALNRIVITQARSINPHWLPDELRSQDPTPRYVLDASVTFRAP